MKLPTLHITSGSNGVDFISSWMDEEKPPVEYCCVLVQGEWGGGGGASRPLVSHILMPDMKRCRRQYSSNERQSSLTDFIFHKPPLLSLKVDSCYGNAINGESYYETHSDKQNILNWKGCDHIQLMGDDNLFSWESRFFFIMCGCR